MGVRRALSGWLGVALVAGVAGRAPAQGPPPKLAWILEKAEIRVRAGEGGRYVVEAYLDYHPPPEAHPQIDPGALTIWFLGDPKRQDLKLASARLNGKEVLHGIATDERKGTMVLLHIACENRVAPLAVHLVTTLNEVRGRVALPVSFPHPGVRAVIRRPDGSEWRPAGLPANLVVNPEKASAAGITVLALAVIGCFVAAVATLVLIFRRRDGKPEST